MARPSTSLRFEDVTYRTWSSPPLSQCLWRIFGSPTATCIDPPPPPHPPPFVISTDRATCSANEKRTRRRLFGVFVVGDNLIYGVWREEPTWWKSLCHHGPTQLTVYHRSHIEPVAGYPANALHFPFHYLYSIWWRDYGRKKKKKLFACRLVNGTGVGGCTDVSMKEEEKKNTRRWWMARFTHARSNHD